MTTISVNMSAQISGGPQVSITNPIEVEAYDKLEFTLEAGGKARAIEVQPSSKAQVTFLFIKSSLYSNNTSQVSYKISGATPDINLDGPQVYMGKGAVAVLGADPKVIEFTNTYAADPKNAAKIEILVGRNASP